MEYGVAYKDINGMDFQGLPWITGGLPTAEEAKSIEKNYISIGYQNVIAFQFDKPEDWYEDVSWEYVNNHKID